MIIHVFEPFEFETQTFAEVYVQTITSVDSYNATLHAAEVGEFSLTLPLTDPLLAPGQILNLIYGSLNHWLIIREISTSAKDNKVTVKGTDLKGLLQQRITLYADEQDTGTFGYDVVRGYTSECCLHYINNNLISPADENRKIPRLRAEESRVGRINDTYMSRFEFVSDVVQKLCEDAGLNYDIAGDYDNNCFTFRIYEPVDRSAGQTEREQIIFSRSRKNAAQISYEYGNTELKNVFYATKSGGTLVSDAVTVQILRAEDVPSGYDRREIQLNVSCDDVSDIEQYAIHDTTEYVETKSMKFDVADPTEYGVNYYLGDKISVKDEYIGLIVSSKIKSVSIALSRDSYSLTLEIGKATPKIIKKLENKIKNGVK